MVQALPHLLGFLLPVAVVYGVRLGGFWTFLPVGLLVGYYDADRLVFAGRSERVSPRLPRVSSARQ